MNQTSAKRRNAVVAGAAGVALLVGGSTYALWSDSDQIEGGTITAGDLQLTAGTLDAYDVSADRVSHGSETIENILDDNTAQNPLTFVDGQVAAYNGADSSSDGLDGDSGTYGIKATDGVLQGHTVALADWLIVPGDTVAAVAPYQVKLLGDNLVAELTLDGTKLLDGASNPSASPSVSAQQNSDMVYHYALFGQDGKQISAIQAVDTTSAAQRIALIQAANDGQAAGANDQYQPTGASSLIDIPVIGTDTANTGEAYVTLVVFGHFKDTGTTQVTANANTVDQLGDITVNLTQVRTYSDGYGNAAYPGSIAATAAPSSSSASA